MEAKHGKVVPRLGSRGVRAARSVCEEGRGQDVAQTRSGTKSEKRRDRSHSPNQLRARGLQDGLRRRGAVRLDLDEKVGVQGVGDFVPCEEDLGHGEELAIGAWVSVQCGRRKNGCIRVEWCK